jgi:septal ring-binding cell division protein DamX
MILTFLSKFLDIPEANARILYDQWVEQSQMDLFLGKSVTVAGLGRFHMENGLITFVADPELELYGNRVYAGLERLSEEEAPAAESDSDDSITEIIKPKKLPSVPKKAKLDVTPAPEPPQDAPTSTPEPVKTAFTLDTQAMADPEPEPDHSDAIILQTENPVMEPQTEHEPEPIAKPVRTTERATVAAKPKTSRTAWFIAVPIAVLVIVGSWYGVQYFSTNLQSEMNEARVPALESATAPQAEAEAATEPATEPAPDPAPVTAVATPAASPLAEAEYGLRGPLNPLEGRVYGIIVHSLPLKEESDAQCAKISALGLRCSVVESDRNGIPTYRVAIGQFATAADAQNAVSELPSDYAAADKHFIARIQ